MLRFGVDVGGTKIEIIAIGPDGSELLRWRTATPKEDYDAILGAVAGLVRDAEAKLDDTGSVGVGTPGSISRATGLLRGSNSICLNGKPIRVDLETRLGRNVRITNDANCFALSEATDGAGAGAEVVFGVILGTGVGAGIVVRGALLEGANAIAGEWGHNPLPLPAGEDLPLPPCYCGRSGCIETYLSGPGLSADHARTGGARLAAEEVATRAAGRDAGCEATIARYEARLAPSFAGGFKIL